MSNLSITKQDNMKQDMWDSRGGPGGLNPRDTYFHTSHINSSHV